MKLNYRMERIVGLTERVGVTADVGCDHGKVGVALLLRGKADRVLFCDVSAPSLSKAEALSERYGLTDRSEFYCRDGLGDIECDQAVIAGMGGGEILEILKSAENKPRYLVLQPMHDSRLIRKELSSHYRFTADFTFYGGDKYYDIMRLERGYDEFTEREEEFGRDNVLRPTEDFLRFLRSQIATAEKVLAVSEVPALRQRKNRMEVLLSEAVLKKELP